MGLLDLLFKTPRLPSGSRGPRAASGPRGVPSRPGRSRRRCVKWRRETTGGVLGLGGTTRKRCVKYTKSPEATERVERERAERERRRLDRQAEAFLRKDNQRRERERQQQERQRQRRFARDADAAIREERRTSRTRERLRRQGWTDEEIAQLERSSDDFEINPGRRRLRLALDFLHGSGGSDHVRRNPTCGTCLANPSALDWSTQFHGSPEFRRGNKVLIGDVEKIVYRVPDESTRAGALWEHTAGDRGALSPRNQGRAKLLADPRTGSISLETKGSGVRFSPQRGLIG